MKIIYTYFLSLIILITCDFTFLGYLMKDYYSKLMSPIVTINFSLIPAFIFYILFLIGLFIFAIYPSILENNLTKAVILGALFGFSCYMTYDLTNLATIKDWPLKLIFIDIAWGTLVSGLISFIAFNFYFWIK